MIRHAVFRGAMLAVALSIALPAAPVQAAPGPEVTKVEPTHGPASGGTSVTITGTSFTGAEAVHFGSTAAASFTVNSETSITAVSPAGSGNVDVTVTTPKGTSPASLGDVFDYGLPPTKAFPNVFLNGKQLTKTQRPVIQFGDVQLENKTIGAIECLTVETEQTFNETTEGTEKGFLNTEAYSTFLCKGGAAPCKVKNTKGEEVEGIYLTAKAPPVVAGTEAHETGISSVPWTGEFIEREPGIRQVLTKHVELWVVFPPSTVGTGPGCLGTEVPFEDAEGKTEKEEGYELAPVWINGAITALKPSKGEFLGESGLTERGFPETGRLKSEVGDGFLVATKLPTGGLGGAWELVQNE